MRQGIGVSLEAGELRLQSCSSNITQSFLRGSGTAFLFTIRNFLFQKSTQNRTSIFGEHQTVSVLKKYLEIFHVAFQYVSSVFEKIGSTADFKAIHSIARIQGALSSFYGKHPRVFCVEGVEGSAQLEAGG